MNDSERLDWVLATLAMRGANGLVKELVRARQRTPYDRRTIDIAMGEQVKPRLWECPNCEKKVLQLYTVDWPEKELPETCFHPIMCIVCWAPLQQKSPGLQLNQVEL